MTVSPAPPSRTNIPGIVSVFLGLVGIGLFLGIPWTLQSVIPSLAGLLLGIVAVSRSGREKVTGIVGIVFSAVPLAIYLVTFVAQTSAGR